jgi:hypothetical protein
MLLNHPVLHALATCPRKRRRIAHRALRPGRPPLLHLLRLAASAHRNWAAPASWWVYPDPGRPGLEQLVQSGHAHGSEWLDVFGHEPDQLVSSYQRPAGSSHHYATHQRSRGRNMSRVMVCRLPPPFLSYTDLGDMAASLEALRFGQRRCGYLGGRGAMVTYVLGTDAGTMQSTSTRKPRSVRRSTPTSFWGTSKSGDLDDPPRWTSELILRCVPTREQ